MPIQLTCPNKACGHVLSVPEKFAGQQGVCPHCRTAVTIPQPIPVHAPGAKHGTGNQHPELAEPELVPEPELVESGPATGTMARPVGVRERKGSRPPGFFTRLAFALGIFALLVLSLTPQMDWVYLRDPEQNFDDLVRPNLAVRLPDRIPSRERDKGNDKNSSKERGKGRDDEKTYEAEMPRGPAAFDYLARAIGGYPAHTSAGFFQVGYVFLFISSLVAALNLVALALAPSLKDNTSESLMAAGGSAALAWGLTALIWLMAFIWRASTLSQQRSVLKLSIYPGIGIAAGLSATVIILAVFSYVILSRRRIAAWLVSGSMGLALGALMLILNVRPWVTPGIVD
jgi:hypothetical protein